MTNAQVIKAFCTGSHRKADSDSLHIIDNRLFSYYTCIGEITSEHTILVNVTRYSNTTSKHQGLLRRTAISVGLRVTEIKDVNIGSLSLSV